MSQTKIHGARPILGAAEARANVQVYFNEVDQMTIHSYEDYLCLTGEEGVKLPQALGSLVFQYGQQSTTRATRVLTRRHEGWNFEASALRASRLTSVGLRRYRRYAHVGPREQSQLFFLSDDPASGFASREAARTSHIYHLSDFRQPRSATFERETLPDFLAISQVLIQDLLDSTAVGS